MRSSHASTRFLPLLAVLLLTACSSPTGPEDSGETLTLPRAQAEGYTTAYIESVVPAPPEGDLREGAGEYVVVTHNAEIRVDLGGWWIEDADGQRLRLGLGRQIESGQTLRVYSSCGENTDTRVFACVAEEVLSDEADTLTLHDSSGTQVAEFSYGQ